jgi:hypothetical protein
MSPPRATHNSADLFADVDLLDPLAVLGFLLCLNEMRCVAISPAVQE